MKSRFKRNIEREAPKPLSFSIDNLAKPTKKMKKVVGKIKKDTKDSAPTAFIPHEDDEF